MEVGNFEVRIPCGLSVALEQYANLELVLEVVSFGYCKREFTCGTLSIAADSEQIAQRLVPALVERPA